ncbi:thioesterase-like superfamily-domain-containing protein [Mycena amicta]|nr:thioesterase-like superfamily-domain-containing protein [Mycena amicta]
MAPLTAALKVLLKPGSEGVYLANVDDDWAAGSAPNGGYVLGLIVQATLTHQGSLEHPAPLHVSAHYLQPTSRSPAEIHVRILKRGRSFVNILAELVQSGALRVSAHLIFGKPTLSSYPRLQVSPASGFARRIPLCQHPAEHVHWAQDPFLLVRNAENPRGLTVWGAWVEQKDPDERITYSSLAFLADCSRNISTLWPASVTDGGIGWTPTLALNLEFKHPIPPPSDVRYAARTVGVYVVSGYLGAPQNRHNTFVEIWTAPSDIGEGRNPIKEGWRDEQVCLAVASQMQLLLNKPKETKL